MITERDKPVRDRNKGPGRTNTAPVVDPVADPVVEPIAPPTTTPATTPTQGGKREQREQEREQRRQEGQTAPPAQTPLAASPDYTDPNKVSPLVSEQLTGLLSQSSPYMQAARTSGEQYANTRGLLNSSLGAEASQQAAIKAALPVAQQDAQFSSGMEQERLASELSLERERTLQDDRLIVGIMESDMTQTQKEAAVAFLQGDGASITAPSDGGSDLFPEVPPAEAIGTDWQKIQQEHGSWRNFVLGEKGQAYAKENALPKTNIQVTDFRGNPIKNEVLPSYPNVLKELYGDRKYGYSKEEIERANRFGDPIQGNWQNLNFMLDKWLSTGDNIDKNRWALAKELAGE